MDVEALLTWAYRDERVHEAVASEARRDRHHGPAPIGTNAATVVRVGLLGCLVDGAGAGADMAPAAPVARDALAIDALVRELDAADPDARLAGTVIHHALRGSRPETFDGITPRPVARRHGANDRPVMVYADAKARVPLYCPVDYSPTRADIETARLMYVRWWVGLDWLVTYLPDVLRDHDIKGFFAAREPWSEAA